MITVSQCSRIICCLKNLFFPDQKNNSFNFLQKRHNNLAAVIGNAMLLVLDLSKNAAFAIFMQFLVTLGKISP